MTRRFQSRSGSLPPEAILTFLSVGAAVAALFGTGGPYGAACLVEVAGAAFATALGINLKRPWLAGLIGAALASPVATAVCVAIGWSSC
jgi:hypothetical protein